MEQANRQLVEDYLQVVWHEGELAGLDRFLSPSYRRHLSPTSPPLDRASQADRLQGIRRAFPDVRLTTQDMLIDGDRVAFRSIMRGTHAGEFLGLPPTGRTFTIGLVDVVRIADGRIVEHWGGPDLYDLVRQLGATVTLDPHVT